jgi:hypothetical protein
VPKLDSPNGQPTARSPLANFLAQRIARLQPDTVKIGKNVSYTPGEEDDSASWADVAEMVDGTRWLLRGWVPYGMLSGIVAEPKMGKSGWVLWGLVRPIIMGLPWFTEQGKAEPGNVVWCDTEGSIGLNIDRAKKWHLPLERIKVPFPDDPFRRIDLENVSHMARLVDVICRYEARLLVVDSFRGAHKGDENSSRCGIGLQALASIAEKTQAAVHVIHHTNKLAPGTELTANNARGSNVFLAMVRCLLGVDRPDPRSEWRRVRVLCENFGVAPKPLGFRISDKGLEFGPAPEKPVKDKQDTGKDQAEKWLRVRMKPGQSYPAAAIIAEAEAAGFSHTGTLQRAKAALKVETVKTGKHHYWRRSALPDESADGAHGSPVRYTYALVDGTAIKVGRSDQHPEERLSGLQTGNPRPLRLLAYTTQLTEAQVKERLAEHHLRGEWFRLAPAVLAEIARWDWCDEEELARLRDDIA